MLCLEVQMKTMKERASRLILFAITINLGSLITITPGSLAAGVPAPAVTTTQDVLLFDDFESGLGNWDVSNEDAITIVDLAVWINGRFCAYAYRDSLGSPETSHEQGVYEGI